MDLHAYLMKVDQNVDPIPTPVPELRPGMVLGTRGNAARIIAEVEGRGSDLSARVIYRDGGDAWTAGWAKGTGVPVLYALTADEIASLP